jgi:26S proteasome regulatory subunit N1
MAKDDEKKPTAAEKGKGKAPLAGDVEKAKDAKPDGKDKMGGAATTGGMFACGTATVAIVMGVY